MKKQIAFFDFDGTITKKDTLIEFIKFTRGTMFCYLGFFLNSPYIMAYKLKLITNQRAKEKVLQFFFKDTSYSTFQGKCNQFASEVLEKLVRPRALQEIQDLQKQGVEIVIVSASPGNWIKPWSEKVGARLIATRLHVKNNKMTGNIHKINCHGEEKVSRIKESFVLADYENIFAYGDTPGDKPMLQLATKAFYKPFREKVR